MTEPLKLEHWPKEPSEDEFRRLLREADQVAHVLSMYHASSPVLERYRALRERFE